MAIHTDKFGIKNPAMVAVLNFEKPEDGPIWRVTDFGNKINMLIWGPAGAPKVFTAHDDGVLSVWSAKPDEERGPDDDGIPCGKKLKEMKVHYKNIISMNVHKNFILTASSDHTAKALFAGSPDLPTAFQAKTNRPLRSVAAWDFAQNKCKALSSPFVPLLLQIRDVLRALPCEAPSPSSKVYHTFLHKSPNQIHN